MYLHFNGNEQDRLIHFFYYTGFIFLSWKDTVKSACVMDNVSYKEGNVMGGALV